MKVCFKYTYSGCYGVKSRQLIQTVKFPVPFCKLEQIGHLVKNIEKWCPIFSQQDGVKDGYRPLSNFYRIVIMFLGVNNGHASESKCIYFMAREITRKRK